MDYQKLYDDLITFRQEHPAQGYTERHHIVMRSMGGSDDDLNLVALTGREHWIAHLLLHKIHRNEKTAHACHMMAMRCEERGIAYIKNSRMYEKIRLECAKYIGLNNSHAQRGKGNSQYGTCWICNYELNENRKISKEDVIPDGWIAGRITIGHKHTEATKEKIKATHNTDEYREKMRKINKGKILSPVHKQKLSESAKVRWLDDEYRDKIIKSRSSPEYREKFVNLWKSDEYRKKRIKSN
jgi:hypothetical protein